MESTENLEGALSDGFTHAVPTYPNKVGLVTQASLLGVVYECSSHLVLKNDL